MSPPGLSSMKWCDRNCGSVCALPVPTLLAEPLHISVARAGAEHDQVQEHLALKLSFLVGVFVTGFGLLGGLLYQTFTTFKINGQREKDLIVGKESGGRFLPPPEYIVESHLLVYQMVSLTNHSQLMALVDRSKSLREEYEERHEVWQKELPEGKFKLAATERVLPPCHGILSSSRQRVLSCA